MRHLIFILICLNFTTASHAAPRQSKQERLINALITAVTITYNDDGAADATVTQQPVPAVRRVINLKTSAIPLLIEHLADQRPTNAKFKNHRVPLGHICLDILTAIVKGREIYVKDCADDGLGACVNFPYYFRPDVAHRREMKSVQRAWAKAYRTRKIKFQYPTWLK